MTLYELLLPSPYITGHKKISTILGTIFNRFVILPNKEESNLEKLHKACFRIQKKHQKKGHPPLVTQIDLNLQN